MDIRNIYDAVIFTSAALTIKNALIEAVKSKKNLTWRGPHVARTSVARTSVARTSVARTSVARTSVARTSVARTSVARTSVARTSVARTSVARTSVARTSVARTSVARLSTVRRLSRCVRSLASMPTRFGLFFSRMVLAGCAWGAFSSLWKIGRRSAYAKVICLSSLTMALT